MADFLSFIDPACCVLNFHTASVELPVCLLQAVLQKLSNPSRNSTGPCSAGDGCITRRCNFGRRGCGCAAGDWGAALAKLVSAGERNLGNFLSLSLQNWVEASCAFDKYWHFDIFGYADSTGCCST